MGFIINNLEGLMEAKHEEKLSSDHQLFYKRRYLLHYTALGDLQQFRHPPPLE
jgi:hypothetical protein